MVAFIPISGLSPVLLAGRDLPQFLIRVRMFTVDSALDAKSVDSDSNTWKGEAEKEVNKEVARIQALKGSELRNSPILRTVENQKASANSNWSDLIWKSTKEVIDVTPKLLADGSNRLRIKWTMATTNLQARPPQSRETFVKKMTVDLKPIEDVVLRAKSGEIEHVIVLKCHKVRWDASDHLFLEKP